MPTRMPSIEVEENWWTDHLIRCSASGQGYSTNITYRHGGQPTHEHEFEDQSFSFKPCVERDVYLYGVFDGHDNGKKVAEFAAQKLPAEILLDDQLLTAQSDDEIKLILRNAFIAVERGYFDAIGDQLAKLKDLEQQIHGLNTYDASRQHPDIVREIEALNHKILGGTSALVVLMIDKKLFVANSGDSRALLCTADEAGRLKVFQLSAQHDATNEDEQVRLQQLGLSEQAVRNMACTRCLGDYARKGGYKDTELLRGATAEPVIAQPDVQGAFELDDSCRFLLLLSAGVYNAWTALTGDERANADIAAMVAAEFAQQRCLDAVAQAVVDRIGREHHSVFCRGDERSRFCQHRDDMSLIVRQLSQSLPNAGLCSPLATLSDWPDDAAMVTLPLGSSAFDTGLTARDDAETLTSDFSTAQPVAPTLPLDADGRVQPYVSFDVYFEHEAQLKAQLGLHTDEQLTQYFLGDAYQAPETDGSA